MTLHKRIADWISGGELSHCKAGWDRTFAILHEAKLMNDGLLEQVNAMTEIREQQQGLIDSMAALEAAMNRIAACETPGANATVRRMARIAREALE